MNNRKITLKNGRSNLINSLQVFSAQHPFIVTFITAFLLVLFVSTMNLRSYDVDYINEETTLHVILTMLCYDEIPFNIHKFLPIITLDGTKFVPWGATIPDQYGNFYHTSFSAAGHFIPYVFIKFIRLFMDMDFGSLLYIFNSLCFILSAYLWSVIIYLCFPKHKLFLSLLAVSIYVFSPENIHSMGYVYWHQTIFQVSFLLQLYSYIKNKTWLFCLTTFINPYIEWTGYIANIGFAISEFIKYRKNLKQAFLKSLYIGILTLYSLIFLCCHWLMVIKPKVFFETSLSRFTARSILHNSYTELLVGYIDSFRYWYLLLIVLIILNLNKKFFNQKYCYNILFLTIFPCIENFIVLQHAILYPYDRMKMAFPLSLMICMLVYNLIIKFPHIKKFIIALCMAICLVNFTSYRLDTSRVWKFDHLEENQRLADIAKQYKGKALFKGYLFVRAYISLLFDENIYEYKTFEQLRKIAIHNNIPYIVEIIPVIDNLEKFSIIDRIVITNLKTNTKETIHRQTRGNPKAHQNP